MTVRNLNSTGGFLPPGVIRCNETNPCENINFDKVNISGWWADLGLGFITEYAHGTVLDSTPAPALNEESHRVFNLFSLSSLLGLLEDFEHLYEIKTDDFTAWEVLLGIVVWALNEAVHLL